MFRIALCDDDMDFLHREHVLASKYLSSLKLHYEILEFTSGQAFIDEDKIETYDLVLLDYEMAGMDGFETAKRIREKSETTNIAFVTVFYKFSREGYRFDAIRYLVKQELTFEKELQDCIQKVVQMKDKRRNNNRVFEFTEVTLSLDIEHLVYVQTDRHYLYFYILEENELKEYKMRAKMDKVQTDLEESHMFSLVRTGQLLNLKYVSVCDKKGAVGISIAGSLVKTFQLSESRKMLFMSDYMRYLGGR